MNSYRNATLAGLLLVVVSGIGSLVGCGKSEPSATKSAPETGTATITAEPNPVPAGPDKGTTTITWNAGPGATGEVYFVKPTGGEQLFGGHAPKGRQEAKFISSPDRVYEFRLYEGKEHTKLLGSVKVTREKTKK